MGHSRVKVVLPLATGKGYDYKAPDGMILEPGQIVRVPLRGRDEIGLVFGEGTDDYPVEKLKKVKDVLPYILPEENIKFIEWVSQYTLADLGTVLKMMISVGDVFDQDTQEQLYQLSGAKFKSTVARQKIVIALRDYPEHESFTLSEIVTLSGVSRAVVKSFLESGGLQPAETRDKDLVHQEMMEISDFDYLTDSQKEAVAHIKCRGGFCPTVINGITGSGKTEVYFAAAAEHLKRGEQVLIMLPEISLTAQFLDRFEKRFGRRPALWHSHLTTRQRRETWKKILTGQEQIIVGTRSALFLPYPNLGMIVVDEEHDGSYKQEDQVVYHGRDMAVVRAMMAKIPVLLASATPSLETVVNVRDGKYHEIKLTSRYNAAELPKVTAIDLRHDKPEKVGGQRGWLSPTFVEKMKSVLAAGHQVMLFLNRRGYAPLMLCQKCGHRMKCPNCDAYMVLHEFTSGKSQLHCHHCGTHHYPPEKCPVCDEVDSMTLCGPGIERIAEEVAQRFPSEPALVMSSDTTNGMAAVADAVEQIENRQVSIIIGTQILTKGHHFPGLTFVGVVDADMSLFGDDFRAGEKTIQLLEQTAGRAGREKCICKHIILIMR